MFVNWIDNPLNAWIIPDLLMIRINQNDFIIFHGSILIDPIRIQNTQIGIFASHLFFGHTLQVTFKFQLIDTLIFGFAKHHTYVETKKKKKKRVTTKKTHNHLS